MKSLLLFIALLCAVTLSSSLTPSVSKAANSARTERAVVKFDQPVQLLSVTLKGEYLFVHNDEAMVRGEACTFIYKGQAENANNLVISFHCIPAERVKAANFTVRSSLTSSGINEIKEYQFAGSTEAHLVPLSPHAMHMTIAN